MPNLSLWLFVPWPIFRMQHVLLRPTRTQVQIRFADTDMLGHINNLSYLAFAEMARSHFFAQIEGDVPWFLLARAEVDFRKEGFLGDALSVHTSVEALGRTSMTLRQDILRDAEELVVSTKAILVCIDRASRQKMPIPAHWMIPETDLPPHRLYFATSEGEEG